MAAAKTLTSSAWSNKNQAARRPRPCKPSLKPCLFGKVNLQICPHHVSRSVFNSFRSWLLNLPAFQIWLAVLIKVLTRPAPCSSSCAKRSQSPAQILASRPHQHGVHWVHWTLACRIHLLLWLWLSRVRDACAGLDGAVACHRSSVYCEPSVSWKFVSILRMTSRRAAKITPQGFENNTSHSRPKMMAGNREHTKFVPISSLLGLRRLHWHPTPAGSEAPHLHIAALPCTSPFQMTESDSTEHWSHCDQKSARPPSKIDIDIALRHARSKLKMRVLRSCGFLLNASRSEKSTADKLFGSVSCPSTGSTCATDNGTQSTTQQFLGLACSRIPLPHGICTLGCVTRAGHSHMFWPSWPPPPPPPKIDPLWSSARRCRLFPSTWPEQWTKQYVFTAVEASGE